jgi:hypothetical protein
MNEVYILYNEGELKVRLAIANPNGSVSGFILERSADALEVPPKNISGLVQAATARRM